MKKLLFALVLLLLTNSATAQLNYINGKLQYGNGNTLIGTAEYNTVWGGSNHYWIGSYGNDAVWLNINTNYENVRISGNNLSVVFRGPRTLTSNGSSYNDIHIGNAFCYSDARAKTNIKDIKDATECINKIHPVSYEFKNSHENKGRKSNREIGFLAQELQEIIPEAVTTNSEGDMLVNYIAIIPILTSSIQELNARIEELEAELSLLKNNQ